MAQPSLPLVSQYLRRLTARYDPSTDHELLQRFVASRDEAAFAALVQRHAAMVLGLCRSILRNHHDAEDIFQAVFLVLARKAGSIRKGESVGSWLYAVAYRLANKARVRDGKRRHCEQQAAVPAEQTPMDEVSWGELREVLHAEVSRLPEKYRATVVLCYWQGQTHEQAGRQLGCARSTIKDRLEKAREMLRTRLARRGLALPAAWFAASLTGGTSAAVSAELLQATVRGAMLFSMGQLPAGLVSIAAANCARRTLQAMVLSKLKYGVTLVLMFGVLGGGVGLAVLREAATPPVPETPAEQPKTASTPKQEREHVDNHGDPLPPGAVARLGTLRFRHCEPITRIGIGTDVTSILTAAGKAVYVWNLDTGKERQRFQHKTYVTSFACSRDGKLLASGCQDGTIHLWDAATGRELRHFTAHKDQSSGRVYPLGAFVTGFTPDGRQIVSWGSEGAIRLWDAASGEKMREFSPCPAGGFSLSPDGKTLAAEVKNGKTWELRLWEVATGRERKRRTWPGKRILSPTFSPDGKMLAITVAEEDWQKPCDIQLWDAEAAKEIRTLCRHKNWAGYSFAPDGKTVASWDTVYGTTRLWDVNTGKEIRRLNPDGQVSPPNQLLFCTDGRTLVSYTQNDHTMRFWDRTSGKEIRSSGDALTAIDFLRFSPDGRLLAAGSKVEWVFRLWDVAARKKRRRFEHNPLTALGFSANGSQLASAAWKDGEARIWDVAGGKELRRISATNGDKFIEGMACSGDGKVLATWDGNDPIRLWNPETGKPLRELIAGTDQIESLVFSPDSKILAVLASERKPGSQGLHILLWSVDTGRPLRSLEGPRFVVNADFYSHARLAFSPDGRMLAAGGQGEGTAIYLWEVASWRRRLTLKHDHDVASLAFSPDGKLLAVVNVIHSAEEGAATGRVAIADEVQRPRVHLWDVDAEKELAPLQGHQGYIKTLSFSPDGKLLATGSNDTTVLLWDAMPFKPHQPAQVQLRPEQLESLWADLDGADAVKAYHAIRTLAAAPKASVAFLNRHMHPVAAADAKQVARLLADLDSEQFAVRDQAMQELEKLGDRAATELHKALQSKPTLEVKRRIEQLLEKQNGVDRLRMVRALETLEKMATPEARELCAALAAGVADAPPTREARATLQRMTRLPATAP